MTPDRRTRLIRLIHVAKRDLAIADDVYRQMLQRVVAADSAAMLTDEQLEQVLAHLKSRGFKVRFKGGLRQQASDARSRMMRGLWLELHQRGVVRDASETALAHFVQRTTGVEALQWLSTRQASDVIEQLKQWRRRVSRTPHESRPIP